MKKIALLTFHRAYNYGARLQAYALFRKLELWGHDCLVVRYETPSQMAQYKIFQPDFSLIGILRNVRNILNYYANKKRKACFDDFSDTNCRYTNIVTNKRQLQRLLNQYDVVLVGSDQTWNIKEKAFDDVYFLPFDIKGKKVSYASSAGDDVKTWSDEEKLRIANNLRGFESLSIRENSGKEMLRQNGIDAVQVVDPTLLLTKYDWENVQSCNIVHDEKYILYYSVKSTDFSVQFVKHLSSITGLKVIAIHPQNSFELNSGFIRKIEMGPDGFIEYISKAKYVVTTSFHATVFSLIFNKMFFCPTKNDRIIDLLQKVNLLDRVVTSNDDSFLLEKEIDWRSVAGKLDGLRNESENYLKMALR